MLKAFESTSGIMALISSIVDTHESDENEVIAYDITITNDQVATVNPYFLNVMTLNQKELFSVDALYFKEQDAFVLSGKDNVMLLGKNASNTYHVMSKQTVPTPSDSDQKPCLSGLKVVSGSTRKPKIVGASA